MEQQKINTKIQGFYMLKYVLSILLHGPECGHYILGTRKKKQKNLGFNPQYHHKIMNIKWQSNQNRGSAAWLTYVHDDNAKQQKIKMSGAYNKSGWLLHPQVMNLWSRLQGRLKMRYKGISHLRESSQSMRHGKNWWNITWSTFG